MRTKKTAEATELEKAKEFKKALDFIVEEKEKIITKHQENVESFLIKCMEESNYVAIN